jgi:hypothetical protein
MDARRAGIERALTALEEDGRARRAALAELEARLAAARRELSAFQSRLADRGAASAGEPAEPEQR